jgi:prepilin-type N-terminal cleavage/methylation domain-containing protein
VDSSRRGFTLIEVLVVVVIIMILAAIGVGLGVKFYSAGKEEQTKTTLRVIMNAVHVYQEQAGVYPVYDNTYHPTENPALTIPVLRIHKTNSSGQEFSTYTKFVEKIKDLDTNTVGIVLLPASGNPQDAIFVFRDGEGRTIRYVSAGGLGGTPVVLSPGEDGMSYFDDGSAAEKEKWGKDDVRSDKIK